MRFLDGLGLHGLNFVLEFEEYLAVVLDVVIWDFTTQDL